MVGMGISAACARVAFPRGGAPARALAPDTRRVRRQCASWCRCARSTAGVALAHPAVRSGRPVDRPQPEEGSSASDVDPAHRSAGLKVQGFREETPHNGREIPRKQANTFWQERSACDERGGRRCARRSTPTKTRAAQRCGSWGSSTAGASATRRRSRSTSSGTSAPRLADGGGGAGGEEAGEAGERAREPAYACLRACVLVSLVPPPRRSLVFRPFCRLSGCVSLSPHFCLSSGLPPLGGFRQPREGVAGRADGLG